MVMLAKEAKSIIAGATNYICPATVVPLPRPNLLRPGAQRQPYDQEERHQTTLSIEGLDLSPSASEAMRQTALVLGALE